jgi:hypothetical protein
MNGDRNEEMDAAWLKYLIDRGDAKGWNPRKIFEAGWEARDGETSAG